MFNWQLYKWLVKTRPSAIALVVGGLSILHYLTNLEMGTIFKPNDKISKRFNPKYNRLELSAVYSFKLNAISLIS